jgi:hypothetical protein
MRENDVRELLLNYMEYVQFHSPRASRAAMDFLLQFKMPMRTVHRGFVLELGANSAQVMRTAHRLIQKFRPVKRHPWKPPAELHEDFVLKRMV